MADGRNCPFYGVYALVDRNGSAAPLVLRPVMMVSHGTQCGLAGETRAPCYQERDGQAVDWSICEVLREHTLDLGRR